MNCRLCETCFLPECVYVPVTSDQVVSHMSKILTNPGSACEQAIERSFTRRNWRHVVMYAIDPTQFPGSNKTNNVDNVQCREIYRRSTRDMC